MNNQWSLKGENFLLACKFCKKVLISSENLESLRLNCLKRNSYDTLISMPTDYEFGYHLEDYFGLSLRFGVKIDGGNKNDYINRKLTVKCEYCLSIVGAIKENACFFKKDHLIKISNPFPSKLKDLMISKENNFRKIVSILFTSEVKLNRVLLFQTVLASNVEVLNSTLRTIQSEAINSLAILSSRENVEH